MRPVGAEAEALWRHCSDTGRGGGGGAAVRRYCGAVEAEGAERCGATAECYTTHPTS